jgi:two-component system chemotaxis response regulator CheY
MVADPIELTSLRVLVIDDVASARLVLRRMLEELGCDEIIEAKSGRDALTKLGEKEVDLVISDFMMEDISGLDLLTRMRGDAKLRGIPFLMVSANSDMDQINVSLKEGAASYILKPIGVARLRSKIDEVLRMPPLSDVSPPPHGGEDSDGWG